jgi:hypothetical protein
MSTRFGATTSGMFEDWSWTVRTVPSAIGAPALRHGQVWMTNPSAATS